MKSYKNDAVKVTPYHDNSLVTTTADKILQQNFSFQVKQRTTGGAIFLFSRNLQLVLTKFFIWEEDQALGYNFMKF